MASKNAEDVRPAPRAERALDAFDRRILGLLAEDAEQSFAELGRKVGLSAPAVHDRVKRLKHQGRIRAKVAVLGGAAVGKPLLAFVHIDTIGWGPKDALMVLGKLPEVEEIHSVTGDTCMVMKVRCASSRALEGLLERVYATEGVRGTRSYVVLSTYLERTPRAELTAELERRVG